MWAVYAMSAVIFAAGAADWQDDFAKQPEQSRPALEVRYLNSARTSFEIAAEAYNLGGDLRKPNRLLDMKTGTVALYVNARDVNGTMYSSLLGQGPTRINLYRRGPYHAEIHWLDWEAATEDGTAAPMKGELVLYCYPDRMYGSITWHAEERFALQSVTVMGSTNYTFAAKPMQTGDSQVFSFPIIEADDALPGSAFKTVEAVEDLRFDPQRGCYTIGSENAGSFQDHFYHHPNAYESVTFSVTNDSTPRTIYVCHQTVEGPKGLVEGGVLLDEYGHPLPVMVQISKNFAGEKEEPFYNPEDTPFSETWFPLHLQADETVTVTSLHLYQNWGRHPVKQFSSLGAWTDYFHSSTGVTETTCFVPFKYNSLDGIDIADLRAMSQPTYWGNQPQHDNVAGHRLLRYKTEAGWQYLEYRGTHYISTGPNWMHVVLDYESSDGAITASLDTFELPQQDELRNFFKLTCQLKAPLKLADPAVDLRLLEVSTEVQKLNYTHVAASGLEPVGLEAAGVPVKSHALPGKNAWVALYGDPAGSNAVVLREWFALAEGAALAPSVSAERTEEGASHMWITPQLSGSELPAGTVFQIKGFFLPYGEVDGTAAPAREAIAYGEQAPRLTEVKVGSQEGDFPVQVRASKNVAEFTLQGGRELIPVIVTGLTDYRWPHMTRQTSRGYVPLNQSAVTPLDGVQVFAESGGYYGAVFLVYSDDTPQTLRVTVSEDQTPAEWINVKAVAPKAGAVAHAVELKSSWLYSPLKLKYPAELHVDAAGFVPGEPTENFTDLAGQWQADETVPAQWFEWPFPDQLFGGRLTPYEDSVELQAWYGNDRSAALTARMAGELVLAGTAFDPATEAQRWILVNGSWKEWDGEEAGGAAVAVAAADGSGIVAIAWDQAPGPTTFSAASDLRFAPAWPECPPKRRAVVRGKLYLTQGALDDLASRIRREFPAAAGE